MRESFWLLLQFCIILHYTHITPCESGHKFRELYMATKTDWMANSFEFQTHHDYVRSHFATYSFPSRTQKSAELNFNQNNKYHNLHQLMTQIFPTTEYNWIRNTIFKDHKFLCTSIYGCRKLAIPLRNHFQVADWRLQPHFTIRLYASIETAGTHLIECEFNIWFNCFILSLSPHCSLTAL